MGSPKAVDLLLNQKYDEWKQYFSHGFHDDPSNNIFSGEHVYIDLKNEDFKDFDFTSFELSNVNFSNSNLCGANFSGKNINCCIFENSNIENANFSNCELENNNFNMSIANKNTSFERSIFKSNNSMHINGGVNMRGASLIGHNLQGVDFSGFDIRNTDLSSSSLTGTKWDSTLINGKTNIDLSDFGRHPFTRDKSETIRFPFWETICHWGLIRKVASLPLFGVSWLSFISSVTIVNIIELVNTTTPKIFPDIGIIPIPLKIQLIILSSFSIALATTIYRMKCPEEVQNFTEASWVFEHNHPRIEYKIKTLQHIRYAALSLFLLIGGGSVAIYLALDKLFSAMTYIY